MNSMKDMDYGLKILRICYLIVLVLALYGHICYTPFSAEWVLVTVIMVFCPVAIWVLSISIKTKNKIIMTREETKERIKVMQAYVDGKDVEVLNADKWELVSNPSWSTATKYRIKPGSAYRPFDNAQECIEELKKHEPFGWVKDVDDELYETILFVNDETDEDGNIVKGEEAHNVRTMNGGYQNFEYYFEYYTFLDGTPFGIKVEDEED